MSMTEYRAAVSAYGAVTIEADSHEEAIEKLNRAVEDMESGELHSKCVDVVTFEEDNECGERWEQDEARNRGLEF